MIQSQIYTEEELVKRLKLHEREAYSYLYDHYARSLFNIIYQFVPQQEVAEDVLQQVFIKIWKSIHAYDPGKGRLFTWMLQIARNQSIDQQRSRETNKNERTVTLSESDSLHHADCAVVRDSGLQLMLQKLPTDSRKLIELSYFMGYTHDEIAKLLQLPLGTVKTRIRASIIQLKKMI